MRLAYRFGVTADRMKPLDVDRASVDMVKDRLAAGAGGRYLLRLTAAANAVEGEVVQAELVCFESKLVFSRDDLLAERRFQPGQVREDLEDQVYRILREVNAHASGKGVLREPITGNVGTIDSAEFLDAIETIAESGKAVTLKILAAQDIYTEGPVSVRFIIDKN